MQNSQKKDISIEEQNLIQDEDNNIDKENIMIDSEILNNDDYLDLKKLHILKRGDGYNSAGSGYNISDHSMDDNIDINHTESIAILTAFDTSIDLSIPSETPLAKCCNAFWNLFKYISIFMALFWIFFLFILLFQPSMMNIRSIIYDIDPISSQNHPVPHRINSKQTCSRYDLSKLAQFSFT